MPEVTPYRHDVLRRLRDGRELIPGTATEGAIDEAIALGELHETPTQPAGVALTERGRAVIEFREREA